MTRRLIPLAAILCLAVLLAPSPARAETSCAQLRHLARQNWELYNNGQDPAHRAAAQNYENAYTAYCTGGGGSGGGGGGGGSGNDVAAVANALAGVLGIIASLGLDEDDIELPPPDPAAGLGPTDEQMALLREDADRELEAVARRCGLANPYGKTVGCGAKPNPFVERDQNPNWDSINKRDCGGVVDFSKEGCVPDSYRRMLASLRGSVAIEIPEYQGADYSDLVLTPEQFRRLATGEDFDEVTAVAPGALDAVTAAVNRKLEAELQQLRAGASGASPAPAATQGSDNPFDN